MGAFGRGEYPKGVSSYQPRVATLRCVVSLPWENPNQRSAQGHKQRGRAFIRKARRPEALRSSPESFRGTQVGNLRYQPIRTDLVEGDPSKGHQDVKLPVRENEWGYALGVCCGVWRGWGRPVPRKSYP